MGDPAVQPTAVDDHLAALAARLEAVEEENRRLRSELHDLIGVGGRGRRRSPSTSAEPVPGSAEDGTTPAAAPAGGGRRSVLGRRAVVAGAAGLAAVAAANAGGATPAAAADGNPLLLGSANGASSATGVVVTGAPPFGIAVADNGALPSVAPAAIVGHARSSAFSSGVTGIANSSSSGVQGFAQSGEGGRFQSVSGVGVAAISGTYGLFASGADGALVVDSTSDPLGTQVLNGSVQAQEAGPSRSSLWYCHTGDGVATTSRWRKLAGPDTAGALHLLPVPVRVYDSRPGTSPAQGPKSPLPTGNVARTIDLKVNASGVPAGAAGVMLTVLLVNATAGSGNMTVWAADRAKPQSNTMVWGGTAGRFTATAMSAVDAQARVKLDASLTTDVVLDVVGYYR